MKLPKARPLWLCKGVTKTDLAKNTPKMPKAGLESVQVGAARVDGWGAAKVGATRLP